MASKRKKAAGVGAGAVAAGKAARDNAYVQRLIEDDDLRDNLRDALDSAGKAYQRIANGRGPTKALLDDKKTQKQLKEAAGSLRDAAESLRGAKKRKKRRGKLLVLVFISAGAALALSEDLRKKALDLLFGAEEEFEYTSTTTPPPAPAASSQPASTS